MPTHWYVTAPFTRTQHAAVGWLERPASVAHAKRVGTVSTACGRMCGSWRKLYDIEFSTFAGDVCAECHEAVRATSCTGSA